MPYTLSKGPDKVTVESEARAKTFVARGYKLEEGELDFVEDQPATPLEAPAEPSEGGTTVVKPDSMHSGEFVDSTVKPEDDKAVAKSDAPVKRTRQR